MSNIIKIGNKQIGDERPVYFIADIAANFDGDLSRAKDLIHLCAESGADAAKFQNFQANTIVSDYGFKSFGSAAHQAAWSKPVYDVYEDASLDINWTRELRDTCMKAGIEYMTTPYSLDLTDYLSPYVRAWKLGSGDITWHVLIERLARDGKPLLIATGASTMDDVSAALDIAKNYNNQIVLMQCNTNYTGEHENFQYIALNVLRTYRQKYPDIILGLSDHTEGHATVLGAVALGAKVIEKHFTDDTSREGPDHKFSMHPASWREMVDRTRELEVALGPSEKRIMENEKDSVIVQRRALRVTRTVAPGETLTDEDITPLRPCPKEGIPPYRIKEVIGRTVTTKIVAGDLITFDRIAK